MESYSLMNNEIKQSLIESITYYEQKQISFKQYPNDFIINRQFFMEWLIFLNKTLSFRIETLFRAATLFDLYISKIHSFNLTEMKLSLIACLNIATKLEEVNVNFLNFFIDRCLNENNNNYYTNVDLAKKEIEILKLLHFKTNYSTPYDFLNMFHHLCKNIFQNNISTINFIINISEDILINSLYDSQYVYILPKQIALYAINKTFSKLKTYNNSYMIPNVNLCLWLYSFDLKNVESKKSSNNDYKKRKTDSIQRKKKINIASPLKIQAM